MLLKFRTILNPLLTISWKTVDRWINIVIVFQNDLFQLSKWNLPPVFTNIGKMFRKTWAKNSDGLDRALGKAGRIELLEEKARPTVARTKYLISWHILSWVISLFAKSLGSLSKFALSRLSRICRIRGKACFRGDETMGGAVASRRRRRGVARAAEFFTTTKCELLFYRIVQRR